MKKDTKEALERFQEQLLTDDRATKAIPSAEDILADQELQALLKDTPAPSRSSGKGNRNTDRTEVSPKKLAKELEKKENNLIKKLTVAVVALTVGILAMLAFWLVRYVGIFR